MPLGSHPPATERLEWVAHQGWPTTPPNPCVPPRCKPARSAFFRAGVRILDFDLATLALADSQPGVAPGPVTLPGDAGIVQHRPDGVRADLGQAIRRAPQGTLQGVQ